MSTRPWALVLSELGSQTSSDWTKDALEIRRIIGVRPSQETGEELQEPVSTVARFLCHLLIERMPDRGLPELCQSMAEFFEFYSQAPSSRLMLPGRQDRVQGVVREVRSTAPFRIPED